MAIRRRSSAHVCNVPTSYGVPIPPPDWVRAAENLPWLHYLSRCMKAKRTPPLLCRGLTASPSAFLTLAHTHVRSTHTYLHGSCELEHSYQYPTE